MKRILIANRGEIACRVAASAHARGYETVAVFSDADRGARHVQMADQAVHIGASTAAESYLNVERLLDAARRTGADAVHPGYGFLAENAGFAEACEAAGLTFIGPTPEAIRLMGSKRQAKLRMAEAGVPTVPGYTGAGQDVATLEAEALKVGLPLMIKASAGGGGRGLRLVTEAAALPGALAAARAEAESAFGDGELIIERAVQAPRHVEIQVFADTHGHVVHLGERDCSVQRRHQKVIEEAPSPAVTPALRAEMGAAAVAAAQAIGYRGAGTVEMLLDADGAFYFMEMNTRLQVEHPVTELVTGLDLVGWQLDVAEGRNLPCGQDDVTWRGHAIEARVYAEDAYAGFLPQVGTVSEIRWPSGEGVRVDHGLLPGQAVTAFYDAMIAKVVAHGQDRAEARRRLCRALREMHVGGLVTNQAYLLEILEHPEMAEGRANTGFIAEHLGDVSAPAPSPEDWAVAAALLVTAEGADPWRSTGVHTAHARLTCGEHEERFFVSHQGAGAGGARVDVRRVGAEQALPLVIEASAGAGLGRATVSNDGLVRKIGFELTGATLTLFVDGATFRFERRSASDAAGAEDAGDAVLAPMAGKVMDVRAVPGAAVKKGEILVVLEAMKMQMELVAGRDGVVKTVAVAVDEQVDNKQLLVELEEPS